MWPLGTHPTNKNEILAWDLSHDPGELTTLDADTVRMRIFTKTDALPEGVKRLPVKSIHLNKSPMVIASLKTLSNARAAELGLDLEKALQHAAIAAGLPALDQLWSKVYQRPKEATPDVDEDLYGGFIGNNDRRQLTQLRSMTPQQLAQAQIGFDDIRLEELLFRYRARNFPDSLSAAESARWEAHRAARLFDGEGGARTLDALFEQIDALSENADERGEDILGALYDYAEMIAPSRD
jgi:exodeoxyribonuclease-1